jgi:hypothetical protein
VHYLGNSSYEGPYLVRGQESCQLVKETIYLRIFMIIVVGYLMKSSLNDKKVKKVKKKTIAGNLLGTLKIYKNSALNAIDGSSQKSSHDKSPAKKIISKNKIIV